MAYEGTFIKNSNVQVIVLFRPNFKKFEYNDILQWNRPWKSEKRVVNQKKQKPKLKNCNPITCKINMSWSK